MTSDAKPFPSLVIGQPVRVKAHPQIPHSDWKPGVVLSNVAPRSYLVEVNGRTYRDTIQSKPVQPPIQQTDTADPSTNYQATKDNVSSNQSPPEQNSTTSSSADIATPPTSSHVICTRSGRTVKPNSLLKDFVQ